MMSIISSIVSRGMLTMYDALYHSHMHRKAITSVRWQNGLNVRREPGTLDYTPATVHAVVAALHRANSNRGTGNLESDTEV